MRLNDLSPAAGSVKEAKRKGRGIGTGNGKTGGRGHKGQNARAGGGVRPGCEGGQMPLHLRLPKRGFTNIFGTRYAVVNVSDLNRFEDGAVVGVDEMIESGLVTKVFDGVKVLGNGELDKKLTVKATAFSESAKEKIQAKGGNVEVM